MSKAFTREGDGDGPDDDDDLPPGEPAPPSAKNLMTRGGYDTLRLELTRLLREDRPRIVEIVSWAAGNGDRSENGDYIYNKKKLREIDRRVRYLTKRLEDAEIVDISKQKNLDRVFFGASVVYERENGTRSSVTLVGVDEADFSKGKINWQSPVGRALMKARAGDEVEVRTESGLEYLLILSVSYDAPA